MCIPHKSPSNIWRQWLGPLVTSLFCSPNSPTYWSALHNNLFLLLVTLSLSSWGCLPLFLNSVFCRSKHISSEVQTKLRWNEILPASFLIIFLSMLISYSNFSYLSLSPCFFADVLCITSSLSHGRWDQAP